MRAAWTAFWIASAFFLFEFVTRIEPSLAAGPIARFYGLSNGDFGTLASLFFWIYAPMQIVVGLLLDRYGARRFILLGSFACAAGVLTFAATHNVLIGGLGRVLTGFGASFAFVAALWLVNHWFAPERFALLSGGVNAVGMLGTAIGAVALSNLITQAGWHAVFFMTGISGLAIFVLALLFLREPHSPASTATSAPAEHVRQSLADVVGHRRTWVIAIVGLLYYMPVNVYGGLWGTTELMKDHHLSRVTAETAVSMVFWGMAAGSVGGGWLSDRLGHRKYLVFFGCVAHRSRLCRRALSAGRRDHRGRAAVRRRLLRRPADADLRHGQGRPAEPARRHRRRLRQHDRHRRRADLPAAGRLFSPTKPAGISTRLSPPCPPARRLPHCWC